MAENYTKNMFQTATRWPAPQDDGLGNLTFSTADLINVRYENKSEIFRDAESREVMSNAIIYSQQNINLKEWIVQGDQTGTLDPRTLGGAFEVRKVDVSPDLKGNKQLIKAYL